jgi:hypothetical protein
VVLVIGPSPSIFFLVSCKFGAHDKASYSKAPIVGAASTANRQFVKVLAAALDHSVTAAEAERRLFPGHHGYL